MTYDEYLRLLDTLDRMPDLTTQRSFVQSLGLHLVGKGEDRVVFLLDVEGYEPTVLKLCRPWTTWPQNQSEVHCAIHSESPLVPEVYAWGPSGARVDWVEAEYMRAVGDDEFKRLAGIRISVLHDALMKLVIDQDQDADEKFVSKFELHGRQFARDLVAVLRECALDAYDIGKISQWGVASDGTLKLLDLGISDLEPGEHEPPKRPRRRGRERDLK